jgi:hypothetical protein
MHALATLIVCAALSVPAGDFSGKVVGISDGDTITVLRERTPVRVRLHGIDCRASCYLAPYPSFNEEVSRISNLDQPAHRTSKEGKGPKHVGKAEAGKIS